jgi:hypothetical protein
VALKDKKLPSDFIVDKKLMEAIRSQSKDNAISCASVFAVAKKNSVNPLLIGQTADVLQVHLSHCQLGLFGFPGHAKGWNSAKVAEIPAPEGLEAAIRSALGPAGELTCGAAWELADLFHISRMLVGYVTDKLNIRLHQCQLGAF